MKKIKHYFKLVKLIYLFKKSKKNGDYFKHFHYVHGGNAFILLPKDKKLSKYCLKCPMEKVIFDDIVAKNKIPELDLYFEAMRGLKGNVDYDLINYFDIKKNDELKNLVVNFYFPTKYPIGKNVEFIIMDFLKGEEVKLVSLSNPSNELEEELISICQKFIQQGYEFGDSVEAIYDEDRKKMFLIDLGGLNKIDLSKKL